MVEISNADGRLIDGIIINSKTQKKQRYNIASYNQVFQKLRFSLIFKTLKIFF
jgi:hypothetical protein